MNIRTIISILSIAIVLFVGGIMPYINNAPIWGYVLWGLAGILVIVTLICYFIQKYRTRAPDVEEHNPNIRWL